jgi:hypothetical protein
MAKGSAALKKITTRAKQIRRKRPGMKWKTAIKEAGAEYRGGRLGTPKNKYRQTGTSDKKRDEERRAIKPGKRRTTSRSGKKTYYYERRKNRSDMPGKLTGTKTSGAYNEMILRYLKDSVQKLKGAETHLQILKARLKVAPKAEKKLIRGWIKRQQTLIRATKQEITIQKGLLK